jgi:hypothetical protein
MRGILHRALAEGKKMQEKEMSSAEMYFGAKRERSYESTCTCPARPWKNEAVEKEAVAKMQGGLPPEPQNVG